MKYLKILLCSCVMGTVVCAAPPSNESVEKLLAAMEVEKLIAPMYEQIDGMMKESMVQALRGQDAPLAAREFADSFRQKTMRMFREEMNWPKLKELYVGIYSESFTQEEIDGLIAFYVSPAGKAFVAKMPLVMQKTMTASQQMMGPMLEKLQQLMQEAAREIEAMAQKNG